MVSVSKILTFAFHHLVISEVLRSHGESSGDLVGVRRLRAQGIRCWRGQEGTCAPDQAGFSASLINVVSGSSRLDWSRICVSLTRGLRIPWGILCGSLRVSADSPWARDHCAAVGRLEGT